MTRKIRFSGFQDGETVTLSATKGSATRGPVTVSAWKQGATGQDAVFQATSTVLNADARPLGGNTNFKAIRNFLDEAVLPTEPPNTVLLFSIQNEPTQISGSRYRIEQNWNQWDTLADDFWVGGTLELWRVTNGVLSMVRESEIIASTATTVDIADDGGVAPRAGDMMVSRQQTIQPGTDKIGTNDANQLLWVAPFANQREDWAGNDAGATGEWVEDADGWYGKYVITALNTDKHFFRLATTGGINQEYYAVLEPGQTYRVEFTMRADTNRTVNVDYPRLQSHTVTSINGSPVTDTFPVSFSVTTSWQTFSLEFTVASQYADTIVQRLNIQPQANGTYYLRNPEFYDASAGYNRLTPALTTIFQDANLDFIRDHSIVKTNEGGKAYTLRGMIVDFIHDSLSSAVELGHTSFWLQPEFYTHNEAADLVEYLAGTADGSNPLADLRASLGRTAPWTDDLHFLFEISNETWNPSSGFYLFPYDLTDSATGEGVSMGRVYGQFFQYYIDQMKTASSFDASHYTFIAGGRFNAYYGDTAAEESPDTDLVARAPYVRGWETGSDGAVDTPQGFFETLFWPATITVSRLADNDTWIASAISNGANPNLAGATYEDAISFSELPPNIPVEEERFARTKAAATCWIDKIARQSQVYSVQAYFSMGFGTGWKSHNNSRTRTYPFHQWTEVFNQHCKGECREVSTISCPTRDVTVSGLIGTIGSDPHSYTDVPEIGCHIFKDGTKWAAVVTNRNLPYDSIDSADPLYDASDSGSREVEVSVDSGSYTLKKYTMSGAWNAHNFDAGDANYDGTITVSEANLGANNGTISETIPAAEAVVYVWEV